jgi:hypothetical protein
MLVQMCTLVCQPRCPHPQDGEVVRVRSFDEWPGPEQGYGDWFGRYPAVVREGVEADYPDAKPGAAPDPPGMLLPQ